MKKALLLVVAGLTIFGFTGCKKAIEAAKEQAVVDAITNGTWYVSKFTEAGTDITTDFAGWEFVYYQDKTCVANKTGNASVPGTWSYSGDVATSTVYFTSAFTGTTAAPAPLPKLASTWTLINQSVATDSKASYTRTESGVEYKLDLTKK